MDWSVLAVWDGRLAAHFRGVVLCQE